MSEYWVDDNRSPYNPHTKPQIRITAKKLLALNELKAKPENDREEIFFTFCIANIDAGSIEALMPKNVGETAAALALMGVIPMSNLERPAMDTYKEEDKIHLRPWIIMKHAQLMLLQYRKMVGGK
jgi:hypothetical protein